MSRNLSLRVLVFTIVYECGFEKDLFHGDHFALLYFLLLYFVSLVCFLHSLSANVSIMFHLGYVYHATPAGFLLGRSVEMRRSNQTIWHRKSRYTAPKIHHTQLPLSDHIDTSLEYLFHLWSPGWRWV